MVPVWQVDDIDEVHQLDPVHQVDHKDELWGDPGANFWCFFRNHHILCPCGRNFHFFFEVVNFWAPCFVGLRPWSPGGDQVLKTKKSQPYS